jgi:hypothetical protein
VNQKVGRRRFGSELKSSEREKKNIRKKGNSVEQLQTFPKTQSEIDISPFLKTQKPSILYSIIILYNVFVYFLPLYLSYID